MMEVMPGRRWGPGLKKKETEPSPSLDLPLLPDSRSRLCVCPRSALVLVRRFHDAKRSN